MNRRHHGFQPCALPTELPRPAARAVYPHEKRRPDRCYRVANVSVPESLGRSALRASRPSPGPVEKFATCEKPRRSSSLDALERHPDRRRGAEAVGDRDVPAGRGDARDLVEERDHVVQRHDVERPVGVAAGGRRRRPRSARARTSRAGVASSIIPGETSTPVTSAPGQRSAASRATAPRAGAEVEHRARRRSIASSAAPIGAEPRLADAVASHSRREPVEVRASSAGGRRARARARARRPSSRAARTAARRHATRDPQLVARRRRRSAARRRRG